MCVAVSTLRQARMNEINKNKKKWEACFSINMAEYTGIQAQIFQAFSALGLFKLIAQIQFSRAF